MFEPDNVEPYTQQPDTHNSQTHIANHTISIHTNPSSFQSKDLANNQIATIKYPKLSASAASHQGITILATSHRLLASTTIAFKSLFPPYISTLPHPNSNSSQNHATPVTKRSKHDHIVPSSQNQNYPKPSSPLSLLLPQRLPHFLLHSIIRTCDIDFHASPSKMLIDTSRF